MREVNPEQTNKNSNNDSINLREIFLYLVEFCKSPILMIAKIPDWNWPSIFTVQIAIALCSGLLAGAIKLNVYRVAFGLFLMPIVSTITSLLLATFFYYYFQFFENKTESFRKLFIFVILSSLPFYIFQIASEYFALISIVGFAFTSLLAVVGLHDNFKVERKRAYQLVGILFILVLLTWIMNLYSIG